MLYVNDITDLYSEKYEPILAFDIETSPAPGLAEYPRERTKTAYKEYLSAILAGQQSFFIEPSRVTRKKLKVVISEPPPEWVVPHLEKIINLEAYDADPVKPGLDPYTSEIRLIQFARRNKETKEIDIWLFDALHFDISQLSDVFRQNWLYIAHNAVFDLTMLLHNYSFAPSNIWCTAIASRLILLGFDKKHSLVDVAKRFCGIELDKSARETFIGRRNYQLTAQQFVYAMKDVEILFAIYDAQREVAQQIDILEVIETYSRNSLPIATVQYCGLRLNERRWLEIVEQLERELQEADQEVRKIINFPTEFSLTQRQKVLETLHSLGIQLASLDAKEREQAALLYKHPFFDTYERWISLQKRVTTYGKNFLAYIHPITGRIHPDLKIAGTDTGRTASKNPNILNIPKDEDYDFRSAFEAPEGYLFGNADYSAMEPRIVADLSNDAAMNALFAEDGDLHSVTAALMFHIKRSDEVIKPKPTKVRFGKEEIDGYEIPSTMTAEETVRFVLTSGLTQVISEKYKKTTRQIAKAVAFLFFYGGTPVGLSKKINCSVEEAERFFATFRSAYPQMARWFSETGRAVFDELYSVGGSTAGSAVAYGNLRRWFPLSDADLETLKQYKLTPNLAAMKREAQNFPAQGSNAVIMARVINELFDITSGDPAATEPEARLGIRTAVWIPIYDEAVVLVREDVTDAESIIKERMENAANYYMTRCKANAEPNPLSKVWKKY